MRVGPHFSVHLRRLTGCNSACRDREIAAQKSSQLQGTLDTPDFRSREEPEFTMAKTDSDSDKSSSDSSSNVALAVGALAVLALLTIPGVFLTLAAGVLGVEYRKVRPSRLLGASAVALTAALAIVTAVGGNLIAWMTSFAVRLWGKFLLSEPPDNPESLSGWAFGHVDSSWAFVAGTQLVSCLWIGLALSSAYAAFRAYSRRMQNNVEGAEYSNQRPFGLLDHLVRLRETKRIRDGHYLVIPEKEK